MKLKTKIFILTILILIVAIGYIINSPHRIKRIHQWLVSSAPIEKEIFLRGSIITNDNVTLAYSQKVYHLSLLSGAFNKGEVDKLIKEISEILKIDKKISYHRYFKEIKKQEYRIVSYGINKEQIQKIKLILNRIISKKPDVKDKKLYAFTLSGEKRIYPYKNMLTPIIGYVHKYTANNSNYTYTRGIQGVEKNYDSTLSAYDKYPEHKDIVLNINFELQQRQEQYVDGMRIHLKADEVMSIVLDVDTFKVEAIASSNRFNPKKIKITDYPYLNIYATKYKFNSGEYIYPINQAILNEKNLTVQEGYKKFGIEDENTTINFMQLMRMYAVFYNGGKIADIQIVQERDIASPLKQIISKENAQNIKKSLYTFFQLMQEKDRSFEFQYRDKNITASLFMEELSFNSKNHLEAFFVINAKNLTNRYEATSVDIPDDFAYTITQYSVNSAANIAHIYEIHSKTNNKHKIGIISDPINKYQAHNENGSEAVIEGIYRDSNGNCLIDRMTTEGTKTAKCNACQEYNVETLKITQKGIISINLRPYDIKTYKPFEQREIQ